jgi:hypothetical protein
MDESEEKEKSGEGCEGKKKLGKNRQASYKILAGAAVNKPAKSVVGAALTFR